MDSHVRPYLQMLQKLHDDIFEAVGPLTDREVNWAHPQLANTIGILLRHTAGSERFWIVQVAGGRPVARNRDAEFGREPLAKAQVVADLRSAYGEVRGVIESFTADDLARPVTFDFRNERRTEAAAWALLQSLMHTSYHLGQIQLYRKMAQTEA